MSLQKPLDPLNITYELLYGTFWFSDTKVSAFRKYQASALLTSIKYQSADDYNTSNSGTRTKSTRTFKPVRKRVSLAQQLDLSSRLLLHYRRKFFSYGQTGILHVETWQPRSKFRRKVTFCSAFTLNTQVFQAEIRGNSVFGSTTPNDPSPSCAPLCRIYPFMETLKNTAEKPPSPPGTAHSRLLHHIGRATVSKDKAVLIQALKTKLYI